MARGTKKIIHHWVRCCAFELNGMSTSSCLNVLPFRSYDMLLGMDWFYIPKTKVVCYESDIEFSDYDGEKGILQGKKKPTSTRMVTVMQVKNSCKK